MRKKSKKSKQKDSNKANISKKAETKQTEKGSDIANISDCLNPFKIADKMSEEKFKKYVTIITALCTLGICIAKILWYFFTSGRCSVYGINSSYIDIGKDSVLFEIAMYVTVMILFIIPNYVLDKLLNSKSNVWFKGMKILGVMFAETLILYAYILLKSHIELHCLRCLLKAMIANLSLRVLLTLFFLIVAINGFAIGNKIWDSIDRHLKKQEENTANSLAEKQGGIIVADEYDSNKNKSDNKIRISFITRLLVIMGLELACMYIMGMIFELNRSDYKVMMVEVDADVDEELIICYRSDSNKYVIYPIVYENTECYIVSRLYIEEGETKIDYNYQRTIEKTDVETVYISDVYSICDTE